MKTLQHPLITHAMGTQRSITSFHYGPTGTGRKVYLQSSLHADEIPGMLVMHHLRAALQAAEDAGHLQGEFVLVPVCNPLGLSQTWMHDFLGRFDQTSGINFNRQWMDFYPAVQAEVLPQLGADAAHNRDLVRAAVGRAIEARRVETEFDAMRQVLMRLAHDADIVLDLHCDNEAEMHLYVETPYLDRVAPLSRALGARAVLHTRGTGGGSFDECFSGVWWKLAEAAGAEKPVPLACFSTTVELRGEADVGHAWAQQDAAALLTYFRHEGLLTDAPAALPDALCEPTPLEGMEPIAAPHAGVLVYVRELGEAVQVGDVIAELVDPLTGQVTPLKTSVSGRFFARENRRFVTPGMDICKINGALSFRTGPLLGD